MSRLDPVVQLLALLLVFFTCALFFGEYRFNSDGQIFQVISNILSGIVGALLMYVKKDLNLPDAPNTKVTSTTLTTATTPGANE